MPNKRNGGSYASTDMAMEHAANQVSEAMTGLIRGDLIPLQEARPNGLLGEIDAGCCLPSHCFRSVSQRSLTVPWRFVGVQGASPNLPAGLAWLPLLISNIQGCFAQGTPIAGATSIIFADANNNTDRARIYDMVLFALRAKITVTLTDATPIASVDGIDVSTLQKQLEDLAYAYINLKIFHLADRAEPWVDTTPLDAFRKPSGVFMRVPPLMWADRDPSMQLSLGGAEFGAGAGAAPTAASSVRDMDGIMSVNIEGIWLPDPRTCPNVWPGQLCPRDSIGMTPEYTGHILSARKKAA